MSRASLLRDQPTGATAASGESSGESFDESCGESSGDSAGPTPVPRPCCTDLVLVATIATAYATLAVASFELFGALSIGVTFFPPAGLTFAAFVLLRYRWWPAVAVAVVVAEVAVDMAYGNGFAWSLGWAIANLGEPMLGATVTRALTSRIDLTDRRSLVAMFVGGMAVGPVLGSAIGALTLAVANDLAWFTSFWHIWVGDALGVLVVAPLVIAHLGTPFPALDRRRVQETVLLVLLLAATSVVFFTTDNVPFGYAAIPLLGWPALRFGPRGISLAAAAVAAIATAATAAGRGPWAALPGVSAHTQLGHQQAFLVAAIAGAWLLSVEARERAAEAQRREQETQRAEDEHEIALRLQQALLPAAIPHTAATRIAGRYLAASGDLQVGGDWYQVVRDGERSVTFVVGDVVGHGLDAAATMGKLSSAARALALTDDDPAAIVRGLDRLAREVADTAAATVVCATLDVDAHRLRYATAGHPPPFLRAPDGRVHQLDGARGVPLGVGIGGARVESATAVEPGSLLVLYTDGLIERRSVPLDDRIAELGRLVATLDAGDPDGAADAILAGMGVGDQRRDDVALLCVAFVPAVRFAYELAPRPEHLAPLRHAFANWMEHLAVTATDRDALTLALGEAATNAVEHGHAGGTTAGVIEVTAEVGPRAEPGSAGTLAGDRTVRIVVSDRGRWRPPVDRGGRGRGIQLIQATCDAFARESSDRGTVITLTRRLRDAPVATN